MPEQPSPEERAESIYDMVARQVEDGEEHEAMAIIAAAIREAEAPLRAERDAAIQATRDCEERYRRLKAAHDSTCGALNALLKRIEESRREGLSTNEP